jgi:hypothetical protein
MFDLLFFAEEEEVGVVDLVVVVVSPVFWEEEYGAPERVKESGQTNLPLRFQVRPLEESFQEVPDSEL